MATSPSGLAPGLLRRVGELLADHAGLRPPGWVLEARLGPRIRALALDGDRYAALLESADGAPELELLIESLRVGETRFFRHRAHVQAVTDVVIPALAARGAGRVRAWSAGCASGEEPYTLAILLARGLPAPTFQVSVLATDISKEALEAGREATYPAAALEHVPDPVRAAFAPAAGGRVRVVPAVASLVDFAQHNLADPDYPRQLDLVWCRNVLIYFAPEARRQAVTRLIDSLAPGGFLFVGYAETLRDFGALEAVRTPDAVLYRKPLRAARPTTEGSGAGRLPRPEGEPERPPTPIGAARRPPTVPTGRRVSSSPPPPPARSPASALAGLQAEEAVIELRGRYDDGERLSRELGQALSGSYRRVVIDLDGAAYLGDAAGLVLRRACSAARAAGVDVSLVAERQSTRRWLARSGALEEQT